MKPHEIMALGYLRHNGPHTIGVIDSEYKMAAAMVFIDLKSKGLVLSGLGENGPTYHLTDAGRAALRDAEEGGE